MVSSSVKATKVSITKQCMLYVPILGIGSSVVSIANMLVTTQ